MRFLVTRPQPECRRTAERLRAAGHSADEAPVLHCVEYPPALFDLSGVSALALTSRRAIAVLAGHRQSAELRNLPVYTVGDSTAEAARQAGFGQIISADRDVAALAKLILDTRDRIGPGSVLYPAAQDRAGDLEGLLSGGKVSCRTIDVYRMVQAGGLPEEVVSALQTNAFDCVLIYSRRSAEAFRALLAAACPDHNFRQLPVYALSQQAGAPLSEIMDVRVAPAPNENALLDLALTQC